MTIAQVNPGYRSLRQRLQGVAVAMILLRDGCDLLDVLGWRVRVD